jgi:2-polyprenyl-3-methyl-5-hydroxy-6-metoxy-1,4-benzoquinol methylase
MGLAWNWGVDNISFSIWNVLQPTHRRFDLVCSTEVLEHIKDDATAAKHMLEASKKYVYCMVPFATDEQNANEEKRKRAWDLNEHYYCGYNQKMLEPLFGEAYLTAGAYWSEGTTLRQKLIKMNEDEIVRDAKALIKEAHTDLKDMPPQKCSGIKFLVRV